MGRKPSIFKKFLKLSVVVICTTGFLYQTIEFLYLYWTYPTVVDIQVSMPSEIELPGISVCNANGFYPATVCDLKRNRKRSCNRIPLKVYHIDLCRDSPPSVWCDEIEKIREDFKVVKYHEVMKEHNLNASSLQMLRKPLEEYFKCKIVSDGRERNCSLDDVIVGSYYSESYMPSFCYSFNTLWSNPDKKIEKIKKSERIQMEFYVDIVDGLKDPPMNLSQLPKYNYPGNSAVQLAVHSPYISPSPYIAGQTFLGGKKYKIKLKQNEKHLLPYPYQTNCTDYMPMWYSRGGIGPLNQLMVIQECKLNASLEKQKCVPITIDYPHNETLCKLCENGKVHCDGKVHYNDTAGIWDHCINLLDIYQQPCFFITYDMEVEEKVVYIEKEINSSFLRITDKVDIQQMGYTCNTPQEKRTRRCMTINIEFVFDNFEITNIIYNPKFERQELFSVIGGYMGMYLGVSIVAMYDFAEICIIGIYNFMKKRRAKKRKQMSIKEKAFKKIMIHPFQYNGDIRKRNTVFSYGDRF